MLEHNRVLPGDWGQVATERQQALQEAMACLVLVSPLVFFPRDKPNNTAASVQAGNTAIWPPSFRNISEQTFAFPYLALPGRYLMI